MKKNYIGPEMDIKCFASDNIVTGSGDLQKSDTYDAAVTALKNKGVDSVNTFTFVF